MAKEKKNKVSLLESDEVMEPEDIIKMDQNVERQEAFREAYKRIRKIVPRYFMDPKKKKNTGSGSGGFAQSIVVNSKEAKVETKEVSKQEKVNERREERERDD